MTKVITDIDIKNGIMFDCQNHAGDHDLCTIISTLCNVLVEQSLHAGVEPTIYNEGHVRIDMPFSGTAWETLHIVMDLLRQLEKQHPDHIKIY